MPLAIFFPPFIKMLPTLTFSSLVQLSYYENEGQLTGRAFVNPTPISFFFFFFKVADNESWTHRQPISKCHVDKPSSDPFQHTSLS